VAAKHRTILAAALIVSLLALAGCGSTTQPTATPVTGTSGEAPTAVATSAVSAASPTSILQVEPMTGTVQTGEATATPFLTIITGTVTPGSQSSTGSAGGAGSPQDVVNGFYNWYLSQGGSALGTGSFQTSQYLSPDFAQQMASQLLGGTPASGDPFLCAQNVPASFTADAPTMNGDTATVVVHSTYSGSTSPTNLTVSLKQSGGSWQITSITCSANQ